MQIRHQILSIIGVGFCIFATTVQAAPRVVADILPTHSIVSRIMSGVGKPTLLTRPGSSPHAYTLQPSEARNLQNADAVFWIGSELTPWLVGPLETIAGHAQTVAFLDVPSMELFEARGAHVHEGGHTDEHEDEDHADEAEAGADHETDPHIWLSPKNAARMGETVATVLGRIDPENADTYHMNATAFAAELDQLETQINDSLSNAPDRKFLVYHDAFQYFEHSFNLNSEGSIANGDAAAPGATTIRRIRDEVLEGDIDCILMEPQLPSRLVSAITDQTGVAVGVLDPLGTGLEPGAGLYPQMMLAIGQGISDCSLTD